MSLGLFFKDELKGFYKSSVMLVLWIGMPLLSILMHFLQPETEGLPLSSLVGILIAGVGGTLSTVVLATSIVNEKSKHVYDLFLIRPVKRRNLMLAKYFAVYSCLIIATSLSLLVGVIIDSFTQDYSLKIILESLWESLVISIMAMSLACAMGILVGILVNSVTLAAILAIYCGNQLSLIAMLPALLIEGINPVLFAFSVGIPATVLILVLIVVIFNRKQF